MKSRMVRKGIVAAKKTKKKVFNFASKNPIKTVIGVSAASYPLVKNTETVKSRQRMKIEAAAIRKELKSGKKLSFKDKYKRMSEAGKMRSYP